MESLLLELEQRLRDCSFWTQIMVLATSTFVSEDLTTIGAGVLVSRDVLSPWSAMLGCFLGILLGDGGLYLIGLIFGQGALRLPLLNRLIPEDRVAAAKAWFESNGLMIVFLSRFLPGTRLPTYLAAGMLRSKARFFLLAASLASALWVPLLVGISWYFGEGIAAFEAKVGKHQWLIMVSGILILFAFIRLLNHTFSYKARRLLRSRLRRLLRWEFWSISWVYVPLLPYFIWLILRNRSLRAPLYVNPGIQFSGIIGESKDEILRGLAASPGFVARSKLLSAEASPGQRLAALKSWMASEGLNFPLILKPDVGQRGSGVGHIASEQEARSFLEASPIALLAQEHCPGPYEFGIFYSRHPLAEKGTVWGITGKEFPKVVGDGKTNLQTLILTHPQGLGRMHIFLNRFRDQLSRVLEYGEWLSLVQTGNHCQGTIFLDKTYLLTTELEARIDEISRSFAGFHLGRFDVRATDLEGFRRGEAFKIIELNGATGEPAHMYDPRHSLLFAYRLLMRQWSFIWQVGAWNMRHSPAKKPIGIGELLREMRRYRHTARYHQKPH
jgi:membrane protein DedA with SNARE-associated domain